MLVQDQRRLICGRIRADGAPPGTTFDELRH